MNRTLTLLFLFSILGGQTTSAVQLIQQPEQGEIIELEKQEGSEERPRSLNDYLSACYYSNTETIIITCQGYGNATVFILSPTLEVLDSDFINPNITPIATLSAPPTSGLCFLFIVTSSFTACGTFIVK